MWAGKAPYNKLLFKHQTLGSDLINTRIAYVSVKTVLPHITTTHLASSKIVAQEMSKSQIDTQKQLVIGVPGKSLSENSPKSSTILPKNYTQIFHNSYF